ncbi:MAG TPA: caspase family protein, partial [Candidatus Obscuribacterales bacterium]
MPVRRACIALMVLMLALSASATLSRTPRHVRRPPPGPSVTRSQPIHPQAPPAPAQPRQPEAAARAPLDTPIADKWALIIGISKFKDPSLNLKFPAKDARDLYTYLTTEGNFAPDHVKLLLNEDASREKILSALGDKWLPRVANPNDLVLIYISTHGSPSSLDVGGVNYLIAYDTDRESLFSTGIPMQDLVRIIKGRVHSDRIVLVLDACHSGAASPDGKAVFHQGNVNVDEIVQGTGQLVISSSAPDQISWESLHQPNGVFTRHLIEALRQSGPETKLGHAYQYMKDKVQEEVLRDRGALQTPVLRSKWEGSELVLAAPATKPRPGLKE